MNLESSLAILSSAVDAACKAKDIAPVQLAVQTLGLKVQPTHSLSQTLVSAVHEAPDGSSLEVRVWWFDPSGPFQNEPDITRFRVTLRRAGQAPQVLTAEY